MHACRAYFGRMDMLFVWFGCARACHAMIRNDTQSFIRDPSPQTTFALLARSIQFRERNIPLKHKHYFYNIYCNNQRTKFTTRQRYSHRGFYPLFSFASVLYYRHHPHRCYRTAFIIIIIIIVQYQPYLLVLARHR